MRGNKKEYEEIVNEHDDAKMATQEQRTVKIPWRSKISLCLLVLINFLNYMDRFTIASMLLPYLCYILCYANYINYDTLGLI